MADWINEERERQSRGVLTPLLQSQHAEINARYPGCTLEYCCKCSQPTGNAGRGEDSLYRDDDGPYCWECWEELGYNVDEEPKESAVSLVAEIQLEM